MMVKTFLITEYDVVSNMVKKFNVHEFGRLVEYHRKEFPDERYGQVLFNVLAINCPEEAEKIRGDFNIDPFYFDDGVRITNFWNYVNKL